MEEGRNSRKLGGRSQKLTLFISGKALSGAPIINGTNQLPILPDTGITIKNVIINMSAVTTTL